MSVIVGRALPDVRDGLKPVHRRVLFAMNELNNDWNKPYKKSARVVGDVIGKYHPHGDSAVYDTIVRMAQPFLAALHAGGRAGQLRLGRRRFARRPCVTPKCACQKIAHELLADLDKETVDFVANYDEPSTIPMVLPTRVPNLLVNGSSGIAVGMATNIPPHNLTEVVSACLALIDNPDADRGRADGAHSRARIFPPRASSTARAGIRRPIAPAAGASTCAPKQTDYEEDKSGARASSSPKCPTRSTRRG